MRLQIKGRKRITALYQHMPEAKEENNIPSA
jgi:hypothetical protein